jgi:hypothetical protein
MATFYLDYEGGNDANDGLSFANRWKTITSGATAARIGPGDTIRIMKSPDPTSLGQNATFTNKSDTITLTSAVTQAIYSDGAWTASANVTATTSTTRKEGANSSSIAVGAAFTTGMAAYYATGSLNLSGYKQVSFWIQQSTGTIATTGDLTIRLCSDVAGVTTVNTIAIPALGVNGLWHCFTVDTGGALGASIQSIAFDVNVDRGAQTFLIDNVMACKDSTSADSLSLTSLIGKSGANEIWYPIKSIVGTTVKIDQGTSHGAATTARGYYGTTETVTCYKRETIKTVPTSTASGVLASVQDSGSSGNPITFSGGWDRTNMSTQDGETWFDGAQGGGYGLDTNGKNYISLSKLSFVRYERGVNVNSVATSAIAFTADSACHAVDNNFGVVYAGVVNDVTPHSWGFMSCSNSNGLQITSTSNGVFINGCKGMISNGASGFQLTSSNYCTLVADKLSNNGSSGALLTGARMTIVATEIKDNASYGVAVSGSGSSLGDHMVVGATMSGNTTADISGCSNGQAIVARGCTLSSATPLEIGSILPSRYNISADHGGTVGVSLVRGGLSPSDTIQTETTVRHTASGVAWKISPATASYIETYPFVLPVAKVACTGNKLVTVKAWMRRTNTALTGKLVCRAYQLNGITSDVTSSITAVADTWEEVTISFTPTQAGVVEIETHWYGGTTHSGYVDDITITEAP